MENIVITRVKLLVCEVLFPPAVDVIDCTCNLQRNPNVFLCSVISMCYLSSHNYVFYFVYMFLLLHAVKLKMII